MTDCYEDNHRSNDIGNYLTTRQVHENKKVCTNSCFLQKTEGHPMRVRIDCGYSIRKGENAKMISMQNGQFWTPCKNMLA